MLGYGLDYWGFESWQGLGIFLFSTVSRLAMGPIQPPIQWVPETLSLGVKRSGCKVTTHLHLMPRSRNCGTIPPLPHTPSWRGAQLKHRDKFNSYLYILTLRVGKSVVVMQNYKKNISRKKNYMTVIKHITVTIQNMMMV
jgi:hypothetical protein